MNKSLKSVNGTNVKLNIRNTHNEPQSLPKTYSAIADTLKTRVQKFMEYDEDEDIEDDDDTGDIDTSDIDVEDTNETKLYKSHEDEGVYKQIVDFSVSGNGRSDFSNCHYQEQFQLSQQSHQTLKIFMHGKSCINEQNGKHLFHGNVDNKLKFLKLDKMKLQMLLIQDKNQRLLSSY